MIDVKRDANKSLAAFANFVKPALQIAFGAKKILPTERHENELETELDRNAGIDGVVVTSDGSPFAYASRVQFGKNYESFSIRRSRPNGTPTEWQKLKNPLSMKPAFHIHSFVADNEKSAIVGIVQTADLIRYIRQNPHQWRTAPSGETFFVVPFDDVGAKVYCVVAGLVAKKITA